MCCVSMVFKKISESKTNLIILEVGWQAFLFFFLIKLCKMSELDIAIRNTLHASAVHLYLGRISHAVLPYKIN